MRPTQDDERQLANRIALAICLLVFAVVVILVVTTTWGGSTDCIDYPVGSGHKSECIDR
jgi:hypothetical protein